MKAVLIKDGKGPAENLYIGEVDTPSPAAGEVLVKIKAFGLNRMDISQREGKYPPPPGASDLLGVEFSGTVTKLGHSTQNWEVGDHVFGLVGGGCYAEYVNVPQTHIIKKPEYLTWVQAASIPENFLTAFQALIVIGNLKKDESVLVHAGASGVGVSAIQIARAYEARNVIATTSSQEKNDWLLNLPNGATHAANYKTQDFSEVVKQITNGNGVDVVIDFVGRTHFNKNLDSLAVDGRMTMLALLSGNIVDSVNLGPLLFKRLHIEGSTLRSRSTEYQAGLIARFYGEVLGKITGEDGQGPIRTYVHKEIPLLVTLRWTRKAYPWDQVIEAHKEMEANNNSGKIILEIN